MKHPSVAPSWTRRRRRLRARAWPAAVAALLLVTLSAASAVAAPAVSVSPANVPLGGTAAFTATGFRAATRLQILVGPPNSEASLVGTVTTDALGRGVVRSRVSRAATPGRYVVLACQLSCSVKATRSFNIVRPLLTAAQAIARVRTILTRNTTSCRMTVASIRAVPMTNARFRVTARVSTFGNVGDAAWIVNRRTGATTPNDQLAYEIGAGCP